VSFRLILEPMVIPSSGSNAEPTSTVSFLNDTMQFGTGPMNAGGVATFSTSSLAIGVHSIAASYFGNGNYPERNQGWCALLSFAQVRLWASLRTWLRLRSELLVFSVLTRIWLRAWRTSYTAVRPEI